MINSTVPFPLTVPIEKPPCGVAFVLKNKLLCPFAVNTLVAIISWGFSVLIPELLGEIADGIKANNSRNLLDLQAGMLQKASGLGASLPIQECDKGHAHLGTELVG